MLRTAELDFFSWPTWEYLYLSPQGRISRKGFVIGGLVYGVVYVLLYLALVSLLQPWVVSLLLAIPSLLLVLKRNNDMGWKPLWVLLSFVPLVKIGYLLLLVFVRGSVGANEYGPDPLETIVKVG